MHITSGVIIRIRVIFQARNSCSVLIIALIFAYNTSFVLHNFRSNSQVLMLLELHDSYIHFMSSCKVKVDIPRDGCTLLIGKISVLFDSNELVGKLWSFTHTSSTCNNQLDMQCSFIVPEDCRKNKGILVAFYCVGTLRIGVTNSNTYRR